MKFEKMHGTGNDYIYVNLFDEKIENPETLSRKLSDRHFGVGSDGLVLIGDSAEGDFSMRMFNADGSESGMCGNASRCVGKYLYERGLTKKTEIVLSTGSGIKQLYLTVNPETDTVELVRVNMGKPSLDSSKIPVDAGVGQVVDYPLDVNGAQYNITCVSMGNPHCVTFVPDVDALNIKELGAAFENHPVFPQRVNTEFIEIIDRNTLKMRVWERGSGETLACGTGACASVVAGVLNGVCEPKVTVKLKGGDLQIEWNRNSDEVFLSGGASFVFKGEIPE